MDKKIRYKHFWTITRLLPVIILLLCSCVVYAQMPTEFVTNPNINVERIEIEKEKEQQKEKQEKKKTNIVQPTEPVKKRVNKHLYT